MQATRALVTGAGQRLGRAIALDLARAGWDVAFHHNSSAAGAAEAAEEARGLGVTAVALQADLLDETAVAGLVPAAAEALGGPLGLLINNASIFEDDRVGRMTRESWDRAMESNLRAPVHLTGAFAEQAPQAATDANGEPVAQAAVINMIDQRVLKPTPFFASYTVAKAGLGMFTRTSAQALAPRVRVNAIGPGPTLRATRQSEAHFARQRAACILGRGSDPEDILAAMRFILACKALTGQMIAVDGGQHLAWQTPDIQGA
ncbi:SDR family oxidoreductase [Paralimibaculum aggregatum]|uniref:SDR family oxidoreductase n=1 Tax=Paralimibaculum aggregatum TaxID=3036245 RepID=A0ABQ6LI42_9RHOB|nr:SDR family oxidoreductase [Limibaculum sp. NKW23]GMG82950.1 SDR family oxidoreductase [Limibaculum sp. NKW23]